MNLKVVSANTKDTLEVTRDKGTVQNTEESLFPGKELVEEV